MVLVKDRAALNSYSVFTIVFLFFKKQNWRLWSGGDKKHTYIMIKHQKSALVFESALLKPNLLNPLNFLIFVGVRISLRKNASAKTQQLKIFYKNGESWCDISLENVSSQSNIFTAVEAVIQLRWNQEMIRKIWAVFKWEQTLSYQGYRILCF